MIQESVEGRVPMPMLWWALATVVPLLHVLAAVPLTAAGAGAAWMWAAVIVSWSLLVFFGLGVLTRRRAERVAAVPPLTFALLLATALTLLQAGIVRVRLPGVGSVGAAPAPHVFLLVAVPALVAGGHAVVRYGVGRRQPGAGWSAVGVFGIALSVPLLPLGVAAIWWRGGWFAAVAVTLTAALLILMPALLIVRLRGWAGWTVCLAMAACALIAFGWSLAAIVVPVPVPVLVGAAVAVPVLTLGTLARIRWGRNVETP
ncbi:hypothetical protein OIE66_19595 [Nonomuraea sp. NBC_01738]|uniref:hypothetical protein n=1 Tax=Nonomuraea sp. NBC_01738 TaxID=2976003 RepID=UPI002E13E6DA|nr:hypothetical protein OIE66_19595 [Nonomuraea sp. NBC_01738]